MISKISSFGDPLVAPSRFIFTQLPYPAQGYREFPDLSDIIQTLENFRDFEPAVRATAIALRASELGISQMHFYVIALHAGLGGEG